MTQNKPRYCLFLDEVPSSPSGVERVGQKAYNLARLHKAGFRVPAAFCITTDAFARHLNANRLNEKIRQTAQNPAVENGQKARIIREMVGNAPLPDDLAQALREAFATLTGGQADTMPLAVRSSGTAEDSDRHSFAGQFATFLNVTGYAEMVAQVKACCKSNIRIANIEAMKKIVQGHEVYAGIDWGSGENTYTVLSLGAYLGTGNFSIFYIHRYTGPDIEPDRQLDLISQVLAQMNVVLVGTDYGGGFHPNAALIRRFGPQKIMKYQYNPQQKRKVYWEKELKRWMCHRTEIMSDIFMALKKRLIDLPNWGDFEDPYGTDILSIFSEYNERTRMTEYKHSPGTTDDAFHSITYCLLASMIRNPRPDILTPTKDTGIPINYD